MVAPPPHILSVQEDLIPEQIKKEDVKEGINAFLEKRQANFRGK